jgi:hypothetical protein
MYGSGILPDEEADRLAIDRFGRRFAVIERPRL